jgi:monoamine oxidase
MTFIPHRSRARCQTLDGMSRRQVLAAALAGAGGLLSLESRRLAASSAVLPRVIVVGAGFAGLACADELAAAGYAVTVVEARRRVGGRVETLRDLIQGKTVEAGGELVGSNQPRWMAYARRFDLKFAEHSWNRAETIVLDGDEALSPDESKAVWQEVRSARMMLNELAAPIDAYRPWHSPQARDLDRKSLGDWIGALDASPRCRQLLAIQFTGINGLIPAWQSFLGILAIVRGGGLQRFWDETDTLHCLGGNQQLAQLLADSFVERRGAASLRLGAPVEAIRVHEAGVVVVLAGGQRLEADDVVVTAPASTWCKIAFDPPLDGTLSVPMAASTKYLAVVNERVWQTLGRQANAITSGAVQMTWEATAGQVDEGPHALAVFANGREADECRAWPATEREGRYRKALEKLFPGIGRAMTGGRFVDWLSDPWARGTYSFPAPGQVTVVGPMLAGPHTGRLHFAGEHCCYAFVGWMEGALASGVQLAHRLCRRDGVAAPSGDAED